MSQITHKPRPRNWRVICLVVATGGFLLTLGSGEGWASETRSQRCTILQNQINDEYEATRPLANWSLQCVPGVPAIGEEDGADDNAPAEEPQQ